MRAQSKDKEKVVELVPNKGSKKIIIPVLPKLHHKSPLFRDGWISFLICGKSGCGKTSLMAQLIPGIAKEIKFICIATVVHRNPFHLAIQKWADQNKKSCVISSSPDKIREFVVSLHDGGWLIPGKRELLLIFDDFSIHNRSGSQHENLVVEAFTRWRNLGVNIIIVCQDSTMVAPSCRNCTNMRILFNSASRSAIHTFTKDVIDRVPDQNIMMDLIKYITSIPYSYILIQEGPLEVSIGKGNETRKIMTEHEVMVPTYHEIMKEIGATNKTDLKKKSIQMQLGMGNTSSKLEDSEPEESYEEEEDDESEEDI